MKTFTRIPVSKNFFLDEFIDPFTYFNTPDNGLSKIDNRLFAIAQKLRELVGKSMSINNWWSYYEANKKSMSIEKIIMNIEKSSLSKWSGLRTERCSIGAAKSAHKLGFAIDPKGSGKELFSIVEKNAKAFHELGVRRLEDTTITPTWLHLDTWERNVAKNTIRVVDLKTVTKTINIS